MNTKYAIIIIGFPGTGKTSISEGLLNLLNGFYCSVDLIHSKLFKKTRIEEDRDYSSLELQTIYNALSYIVEIQAENNSNIIIDGVFRNENFRNNICNILIDHGYSLYKYYIICDDKEAINRVEFRKKIGTNSPAGAKGYWKIRDEFDIPSKDEGFYTISNSGKLEDVITSIYNQVILNNVN